MTPRPEHNGASHQSEAAQAGLGDRDGSLPRALPSMRTAEQVAPEGVTGRLTTRLLDGPVADAQHLPPQQQRRQKSARAFAARDTGGDGHRTGARRAAQIPLPLSDVLFVNASMYEWRALDEQAVCGSWIGQSAESFAICRAGTTGSSRGPENPSLTPRTHPGGGVEVAVPSMPFVPVTAPAPPMPPSPAVG